MTEPATIFYFPLDVDFRETGEAIPVVLKEDGSADISRLPEKMRENLETLGAPNELHNGEVFPKDGKAFLQALVASTNGYQRFRLTPEKRV